ncbi:hypothetical protein RclHR1_10270006 [Rhizophagus clarus]|uniref:Uncharacterized protein n=1 Tax=Rhizophagus clarus TaxID=94130 RepID=A0A2Z6Q274_9GLOM|nr:hypothetical protein RclHR1_10270006 [Rhizophagus clarus]GES73529.1 hypothetical protein RCL_jg4016.t1 [Rhizophagus clarus]
MATVNEGLLRFGHWMILFDLGATALKNSLGTHINDYNDLTNLLTTNGFVRVQHSAYRHATGCLLWHACCVIIALRGYA